jgi:hypothetical protein
MCAQKELQVKLGVIDVWGNLRMGIRVIYEGRHSPLIIILQPQKYLHLQKNRRHCKNMKMYFQN